MRRRSRNGEVVSLFSFQDIMASVIGMLFFIVMIIALDVVAQGVAGDDIEVVPVTEGELAELRQHVERLNEEVSRLSGLVAKHSDDINLSKVDERDIVEEIMGLNAKLKSLHGRIEEDEKLATSLAGKNRKTQMQYVEAKEVLKDIEDRVESLKNAPERGQRAANVAYIIDERGDNLEPWLLEVSDKALRVASRDGASTVIDFGGAGEDSRMDRFYAWVRGQNPRTHYFVLLIKPSGLAHSEEIGGKLKSRGFSIGTDLLPEDWCAF